MMKREASQPTTVDKKAIANSEGEISNAIAAMNRMWGGTLNCVEALKRTMPFKLKIKVRLDRIVYEQETSHFYDSVLHHVHDAEKVRARPTVLRQRLHKISAYAFFVHTSTLQKVGSMRTDTLPPGGLPPPPPTELNRASQVLRG